MSKMNRILETIMFYSLLLIGAIFGIVFGLGVVNQWISYAIFGFVGAVIMASLIVVIIKELDKTN